MAGEPNRLKDGMLFMDCIALVDYARLCGSREYSSWSRLLRQLANVLMSIFTLSGLDAAVSFTVDTMRLEKQVSYR